MNDSDQAVLQRYVPLLEAEYRRLGVADEVARYFTGSGGQTNLAAACESELAALRALPSGIGFDAYCTRIGVDAAEIVRAHEGTQHGARVRIRRDGIVTLKPKIPDRLQWTVELLAVRPTDHLLEIGCGSGQAVALVCERLTRGTITAIDRSATMVARARARNQACIVAGRARIERHALTEAAPGRRFGKVFAVNVNAFWTAPAPSLGALRRLLRPSGAAYLVYEPPSAARLNQLRRWLPAQLDLHGFEVADVLVQRIGTGSGLCVLARLQRGRATAAR